MTFSSIPILFGLQVIFVIAASIYAQARQAFFAALLVALALAGWGAMSTTLALAGIYESQTFLSLLPGLWLPVFPFLVVGLLLVLPIVRTGFASIADAVPAHWFVAVQALRIGLLLFRHCALPRSEP